MSKNALGTYFRQLSSQGGAAWNRFWFEPSHPATVSALRIVAGLATLYYLLSATTLLTTLFAADGLLPNSTVLAAFGQRPEVPNFRFSALYYLNEPAMLWGFHVISIIIAAAFTVGLFSRVTNILTLLVMLSWVHRAPMLSWQLEPVLTMVLLYLCLAPTGACYSLGKNKAAQAKASWLATISVRLIQVHLCMFYLMFALTKLESPNWWGGGAVYLLMAQSESRLIDLTFLRTNIFAINIWTHAILAFELLYGVLIWNRLLRPLLMAASILYWVGIGLLTGMVGYSLLMIALNLAFIPAEWLLGCCQAEEPNKVATN